MVTPSTYFFGFSIPLAAVYGLFIVFQNWKAPFIQKRQPYAQVLFIAVLVLLGLGMVSFDLVYYTLDKANVWTWNLLVFINIAMVAVYILYVYRAWMLWYKNRLQRSFRKMVVDDIPESDTYVDQAGPERNTESTLANDFWVRHRRTIGSPSKVSCFTLVVFFILMSINLIIVRNYGIESLQGESFQPYDYYDITVFVTFVTSGLIILGFAMKNVEDSFRFTGEVRMVSALLIFGSFFEIFWRAQRKRIDWEKASFDILQTITLLVLLTVDFNLHMAEKRFSVNSTRHKSTLKTITMDDILNNEIMFREFEEHLKKEFSLENLNFLKTCVYYNRLNCRTLRSPQSSGNENISGKHPQLMMSSALGAPRNNNFRMTATSTQTIEEIRMQWMRSSSKNPKRATSMARFIYEEYCAEGAPQEINLSVVAMKKLRQHFAISWNCPPPANIFDEAFGCIIDLLTNDSLRRFNFEGSNAYRALS